LIYKKKIDNQNLAQPVQLPSYLPPGHTAQTFRKTGVTHMKKFAIAAATATALTLTMANGAFAAEPVQAPVMLAANDTVDNMQQEGSDTWITTKVKADLMTEKGVPGTDIKVETSQGVVSLSSDVKVTDSQKETAVRIAKNIKGVKSVMSDGLKSE
jgi:hyperosmotically inducible protein